MALSDTLDKLFALQSQLNSQIEPATVEAKARLDALSKELADLNSKLKAGGLNQSSLERMTNLQQKLVPTAQTTFQAFHEDFEQQQQVKRSYDLYQNRLMSQVGTLSAGAQTRFNTLRGAVDFFGNPQQQKQTLAANPNFQTELAAQGISSGDEARTEFRKLVAQLRTAPYENINKRLREDVAEAKRQGKAFTPADLEERRLHYQTGQTFTAADDPRNVRDLARLSGNFFQRNFSKANFADHMTSGGLTAFGAIGGELLSAGSSYLSQPMTGQRIRQEERNRSAASLLPAIFAGVGAGVGMVTPVGPWGGAAVGSGVGSAIQTFYDAGSEQHETLRLTGEEFSQTLGRGTAAADKFVTAIESTASKMGTPAAELANSLRTLSSSVVGFNPAKAAGLQATLQRGAGDLYPGLVESQARAAVAIPLSNRYQDMIAGNAPPDPRVYQDAANWFALHGDLDDRNKQLIAGGQFDYAPAYKRVQAAKGRMDNEIASEDPFSRWLDQNVASRIPFSVLGRRQAAIDANKKKLEDAGQDKEASASAKAASDKIARANRTAQEMSDAIGYDVQRAGVGAGMAQMTGRGAAGMQPYVGQEVTALTDQQAQLRIQEQQVQASISAAKPADVSMFKADLAGIRLKLSQNQAQIVQAQAGLFQEKVTEQQAHFEGGYTRLGISGDALMLGGASVFDPRVARNLAQRRSFLAGQSAYDMGLAGDMTNFLSPMEREQRRTSAAQEDFEARFALPNQYAMQRIGETQARSGERQAGLRGDLARAQAGGGVLATLQAENRLIDDQKRLRDELNQRLLEGSLTTQQQLQLTTQLRDIDSQIVTGRKQAFDSAVEGLGNTESARASIGSSQAERESRMRGTSAKSYAEAGAGYDAALRNVALLKFAADREVNPDLKVQKQAVYQKALSETEQNHVAELGTVSMGPKFDMQFTIASHELSRQMKSPFEPGSVLQSNALLGKLDHQKDLAISAQMARIDKDPHLTQDQRDAAKAPLTEAQQQVRDDLFDRQNSIDVGWMDRLVSMSVNAPSFAARLMPGSDRVASIAEKRGLGRMSARVFGYTDRKSYVDAATMGYLPSETSRYAFGDRPGDYPLGTGPNAYLPVAAAAGPSGISMAGAALTTDSVENGGGLPPQMVGELSQALMAFTTLLGRGIPVNVTQMDKATGDQASHTQNTGSIYSAAHIMRGGQAPPRY